MQLHESYVVVYKIISWTIFVLDLEVKKSCGNANESVYTVIVKDSRKLLPSITERQSFSSGTEVDMAVTVTFSRIFMIYEGHTLEFIPTVSGAYYSQGFQIGFLSQGSSNSCILLCGGPV